MVKMIRHIKSAVLDFVSHFFPYRSSHKIYNFYRKSPIWVQNWTIFHYILEEKCKKPSSHYSSPKMCIVLLKKRTLLSKNWPLVLFILDENWQLCPKNRKNQNTNIISSLNFIEIDQ